ncbi:MAG: rhamnan synthesis F family protein [Devosia sp.]|nr:rhamnan synthesis F family protein [Devosia sp.]
MRIVRWLARLANRIAYTCYVAAVCLRQQPSVLAERRPRFLADETIEPAHGDVYALAVKYPLFGLDDGFLDLLDALKRQNVNTVVVFNGRPTDHQLAAVRPRTHRILIRPNRGRDFGAYRAGTLRLLGEGLEPSRLLYFNDSIIYLPGAPLDQMVGALRTSSYDMVGTFENHERNHHIGSFAFSISGRVFADARVKAFWRRYKTYDLRPHAINKGEIRLSALLKQRGYPIDVIYSSDRMALRLGEYSFSDLVSLLRYIPSVSRAPRPAAFLQPSLETAAVLRSSRSLQVSTGVGRTVSAISEFRGGQAQPGGRNDWNWRRDELMARDALIDQLLQTFMSSSQVHFGFGLFHRVLQCPLVKKDLLSRGVLLDYELVRALEDLPPPALHRIVRQVMNRGRPVNLAGLRRFKLANGLI